MSALSVTIDAKAISANVASIKARTEAAVMAVVKADGYGHGLARSAAAARAGGATWLGVAQPIEALALREAGDHGRLFCWLYGPEAPFSEMLARDIDLSASSLEVLEAIAVAASPQHRARVHLCIDTGLGREGCPPEDFAALVDAAVHSPAVDVVGVWSHLAWADAPGHATIDRQREVFEAGLEVAEAAGVSIEVRHLANSAATLTRADVHYDLVRPGIAIYGLPPIDDPQGENFGLRAAMSVTTRLDLIKSVPAGHGVSYGHDYVTEEATLLGLVPAGYADGVFRAASNSGPVHINGRRLLVAGRVCMDQFVVDLGADATAEVGDTVVLIGPDGPSARDWAAAIGTIDYEVVCRFGGLRQKEDA